MQAERETKLPHASAWREAGDLLRFSAEAAAVSGAIILVAWFFTGIG